MGRSSAPSSPLALTCRRGTARALSCLAFWVMAAGASAQLVPDFSATPTAGVNPVVVSFADSTTGGTPLTWIWDFGDGDSSALQNPTHAYLAAGNYTVSLSVFDFGLPGFVTETKADLIRVTPAPIVVGFTAFPTAGLNPLAVSFTDTSTGTAPTGWLWDFGDGKTSTLQNPINLYDLPGTFSVSLTTFIGLQPDTHTEVDLISVGASPLGADFGVLAFGLTSEPASFSDLSSGPIIGWSWDFGDGNSSSLKNPQHQYSAPGSYDVSLTVFTGQESDSILKPAVIKVADPMLQQAYLKANNTGISDVFGVSLAVSGDRVVVGAEREDSGAVGVGGDAADDSVSSAGAAYVFLRDDAGWAHEAYLKASNTGLADYFGSSVAVSGETIAVGARREDSGAMGVGGDQLDNAAFDAGAVYVFVHGPEGWAQQAYLKASNTNTGDSFGQTLALSGDTLVVGAPNEDSAATGVDGDQADNSFVNPGAAYVFERSQSTWTQTAYLKASNTGQGDNFASSVSISGETIVVGAAKESSAATGVDGDQLDNGEAGAGAVYVFVRELSGWIQQAYVKASNTDGGDNFGNSVSVSGDTLVVGARLEDSFATGVNGNQADNSGLDAGAAYVFERSGSRWTQTAYLKPSNTSKVDAFGWVAVSGDRVLVGAPGEDSGSSGLNGAQGQGASRSGAAYAFVRSAGSWVEKAYIKASNTGVEDAFGMTVAASGHTLLVGAWVEDSAAIGVNGDQLDNSAGGSGAVYVFDPFAWGDVGGGTPGVDGQPRLRASGPLTAGSDLDIDLTYAPASGLVLLRGALGTTPVNVVGGTLYANPFDLQLLLVTDPLGELALTVLVAAAVPPGLGLVFQYIVQDLSVPHQLTLSNAVATITQ